MPFSGVVEAFDVIENIGTGFVAGAVNCGCGAGVAQAADSIAGGAIHRRLDPAQK
jgi:hypothetical protein